MPRLRLLLLVFSLLALAACGRSGSDSAPVAPDGQLPPLSSLKNDGLTRNASATEFELMDSTPVAVSTSGVDTSGSQLSLSPPGDGMSWAVYALQGFPTDGSIVPVSVTIDRSLPCWLAFGDFGRNRWELVFCDANGTSVPAATNLLSPDGTFYVAVIGFPSTFNLGGSTNVSSLKVNVSTDVVLPEPVLKIISATGQLAAGIPSHFSAEGSQSGTGAAITSITYDWHDGSPTQVADQLTEVSYTWPTAGNQTVTLTLENDLGVIVSKDFTVTLTNPFSEMLVVYNSDIPESADLMEYYCGSRHGRMIDAAYVLGLPMGTNANADFNRATYESLIRDPIKSFLNSAGIQDQLKYILLLKGVPHRISDGGNSASVDSELCLLFSDLGPGSGYPYADWLINDPKGFVYFLGQNGDGFYLEEAADFIPNTYQVCSDPTWDQPNSGDEVAFTLNYLVGRLSAYTYDEAKLLVDRSIGADKSGDGWAILDSRPGTYGQNSDRMVDPVWPFTGNGVASGYDLLSAAGYNVYQELTNDLVTNNYINLPAGAGSNVLAYCSWGVHSGHARDYILEDLQFTYLPGACWLSYESFNAWNFDGDNLGNHAGQGQICDFIRMGGTCAIGNCWEPYTVGVGDERWVFDRYINHGDRWIEAAYKGMPLLSWMEVVVGDPLCQVK